MARNLKQDIGLFIRDHLRTLRIAGAGSGGGPADLAATIPLQQAICRAPVIMDLLGGARGERADRYRAASPIELLPGGGPQEFFAGQMFAAQAEPCAARARANGDEVRVTVLADASHFAFIDPESGVWPQVLQAVQRLLNQSR